MTGKTPRKKSSTRRARSKSAAAARTALDVLFCDNHLLVVRKPAGVLVQPDETQDGTLIDMAKEYVKQRFAKKGNVYIASVHRLDRPVSGVVVFARTSKAAARLSEQFRGREVRKVYWALVEGTTPAEGTLRNRLVRRGRRSRVSRGASGKQAKLEFRRVAVLDDKSALVILLHSGRHHQIRVQMSAMGHPVVGDKRYGSTQPFPQRAIALHARSISIEHPTRAETLTFQCGVDDYWPNVFPEDDGGD